MRFVLDIPKEQDWLALVPLLQHLNIRFVRLEKEPKSTTSATEKNFDLAELERLFAELNQIGAFSSVLNPVDWQKKQRDEWN